MCCLIESHFEISWSKIQNLDALQHPLYVVVYFGRRSQKGVYLKSSRGLLTEPWDSKENTGADPTIRPLR